MEQVEEQLVYTGWRLYIEQEANGACLAVVCDVDTNEFIRSLSADDFPDAFRQLAEVLQPWSDEVREERERRQQTDE